MRIGLRVVQPKHPFSRCLDDLADCLADGLKRAGATVHRSDNFKLPTAEFGFPSIDVVLGAHTRTVELPPYPVIIYQTELPSSKWWTTNYVKRLHGAIAVWDAGQFDYELPPHIKRAVLAPGLVETQPADVTKDIDVLFYGSPSERRVKLLTEIWDAGIKVDVHFGVFGEERNALIDRAKVVVDIKQGEGDPDDTTRTFFLDSRGACVLSENDPKFARRLRPTTIVSQVRDLLGDRALRAIHAQDRRAELKPMDARAAVADLFADSVSPTNGATVAHHQV